MQKAAAIVFLLVLAGAGYGAYEWYLRETGEVQHFRFVYEQAVNDRTIQTVMLGRVSERAGWQSAVDKLESDLLGSCGGCTVLKRQPLESLSEQQKALFNEKGVSFHYISMNTSGRHRADIRMFYPSLGERYTAAACEFGAKQLRQAVDEDNIRCVSAAD